MEKLLIGMLSYNRVDFTKRAIESLYKNTDNNDFWLIILDNGSNKETVDYLKSLEYVNLTILYEDKNLGVAGGLNKILGLRKKNQHFMKLDNDIVFKEGTNRNWVKEIMMILMANIKIMTDRGEGKIGSICIKPYTLLADGTETNLIQEFETHQLGPWKFQYNPEGVLGCSTIYRSDIFEFFPKFDEDFIYGYEESLLHVLMLNNKYVSFFDNQTARVYHIDPGGDTDYIKWKHQQAKDKRDLYIKKFQELDAFTRVSDKEGVIK